MIFLLILARFFQEAFFAVFAKNAPRAVLLSGAVLRLLQNSSGEPGQNQPQQATLL
ncbi:MAG: hypothetical protein H7834_05670 [Magnetococcus sp. YQC-9]